MKERRLTELKRKKSEVRKYTYLGCPLTKNRSPWCFRMCKPRPDGTGFCGRVAPQAFKGHIQRSIIERERRLLNQKNDSKSSED
jgi:hypothetical protein